MSEHDRWLPASAHVAVDTGVSELAGEGRAEQKMIKPEARVPLPPISHIVPERIDALVRMQLADGIGPALRDELRVSRAAFRLHERIIVP